MISKIVDRVRRGPRYRYRSAETGQFVTRIYALLHPATTYRVAVR